MKAGGMREGALREGGRDEGGRDEGGWDESGWNEGGGHTANNFGLMYSRKRISQNSFPNFIHIIPKSFMVFYQELRNPNRNYENQI
jgi:hypothetical protein